MREGKIYVSEKLIPSPSKVSPCDTIGNLRAVAEAEESSVDVIEETKEVWLIFDGCTCITSSGPASITHLPNCSEEVAAASAITPLKLFGIVSGVRDEAEPSVPPVSPPTGNTKAGHANCHSVLHMCTGHSGNWASRKGSRSSSLDTDAALEASALVDEIIDRVTGDEEAEFSAQDEWTLFNDFAISKSCEYDVAHFPHWRFPCVLLFIRDDKPSLWPELSLVESLRVTPRVAVPASVLKLPSLSSVPSTRPSPDLLQKHRPAENWDGSKKELEGWLIAFDAEFVSVEVENVVMDATGQQIVHDEGRQVVGRTSLLDGHRNDASPTSPSHKALSDLTLLLDDYVLPTEPVVDYVTRFSGLVEEDLNPATSRHAVVTDRTAYLKLRFYRDSGCIFVGHGLQKDFETANIFVPPEQVLSM